MNHLKARELKKGGFHFTLKNGDLVLPIGYCAGHAPHETAEEANSCYRSYLLEKRLTFGKLQDQQLKCVECGEFTGGIAIIDGRRSIVLCDLHRNVDYVDHHLPAITDIWES